MNIIIATACLAVFAQLCAFGQVSDTTTTASERDSIYIAEIEDLREPDKVLHAEPLFIDLIRDLGARKGEAEWNAAFELTDMLAFDRYSALVEYEWAPINRLGLEVELPVTMYSGPRIAGSSQLKPPSRIEALKMAAQWTFLVSQETASSLALGYIHEFEFVDLERISMRAILKGNLFNPFLVAAKRWGDNIHSLIYTGPRIEVPFGGPTEVQYHINTSLHYMITGTRNFIGLETNKAIANGSFAMTLRPQMRLGVAHNLLVGIGVGIPVSRERERFGMFMRLIWEPHGT
ncbi:MAG: phosphoribosylformylglycinamidine synthase [Candidatus Kapabacteria bacterium]|jgi:hypothetical protein|nr:phosphoribosylformylglycinamidine synthase [Candidatus Kapabacteria bacterium]